MKKYVLFLACTLLFISAGVHAQYYPYRYDGGYRRLPRERRIREYFKPVVHVSAGYGFPNLDRYELFEFENAYRGQVQQSGPVFAAVDYQFNAMTSIGVMAGYGKVSAPYYDYNTAPGGSPAFQASLKDWTVMLNLVRYMNAGKVLTPYLRTGIGVSIWDQKYINVNGNPVVYGNEPSILAYQASLGLKVNFTRHAGLFVEAGYGKYFLSAGLAARF